MSPPTDADGIAPPDPAETPGAGTAPETAAPAVWPQDTANRLGAVAIGPGGALYIARVSDVAYPGHSSIDRIPDPASASGDAAFDTRQVYTGGFSRIVGLGFDDTRDLYVLQNLDVTAAGTPASNTAGPPTAQLIRVAPDGVRTTLSGLELRHARSLLVDRQTGDVYVSADDGAPGTAEILDYHTDPDTGAVSVTVVAGRFDPPAGSSPEPGGDLYASERGGGATALALEAPDSAGMAVLPDTIGLGPFHSGSNAPAPLALPDGADGYTVSGLVVFGDRFADAGNTLAQFEALGQTPYFALPPYDPSGDFSDGPSWTVILARLLGGTTPVPVQNFAYQGATAGPLGTIPNPFDPEVSQTPLNTFAGQVRQFERDGGSFSPDDLVSVTFGTNDLPLTLELGIAETPQQAVSESVEAVISGVDRLAELGAKHVLISNVPDITLAPVFNGAVLSAVPPVPVELLRSLVGQFNAELAVGLEDVRSRTGLDVDVLDLNKLFDGIVADPLAYGFTNVTEPVLLNLGNPQLNPPGVGPDPTYNPAIDGRDPLVEHGSLFLDPLFDATEPAQTLIAQTARNTLAGWP